MTDAVDALATRIAAVAIEQGTRLVLAESCTAGLVAHILSRVPGASRWLCGSAVVYRNETKSAWLGIDPAQLADPAVGPVSRQTAADMSAGALRLTPEADLAVSVTGHLGPNAPPDLDGVVYIGHEWRRTDVTTASAVTECRLPTEFPHAAYGTLRRFRQWAASEAVLHRLLAALESQSS